VSVKVTDQGDLAITVPYTLGFSMLWDSFKCELKGARVFLPGTDARRHRTDKAKQVARLMIDLSGREAAIIILRGIAQHVRGEVNP
jgi:hypothetical protein